MNTSLIATLLKRHPKRALMFSIRLTEAEQDEIDALAKRLNLTSSYIAHYFILEAAVEA